MTDKEKTRLWAKGRLFEVMNGIGEQDAKSVLTDLLSLIETMSDVPEKDFGNQHTPRRKSKADVPLDLISTAEDFLQYQILSKSVIIDAF